MNILKSYIKLSLLACFTASQSQTYNLLKAKLEGILAHVLSAMKYNKPREKLLTGPVLFICAMHISNTLIDTSASR